MFFIAPRNPPKSFTPPDFFTMDPIKKLIGEVKKKYKLKGYTQEQIKSWIAIEFHRMEEELDRRGKFRVIDRLKK